MIDPLTLDQMRVLVAVADTGSFSAASRRLGRVQSAISQAVRAMETTLGVALFDRSTKTPTLTEAGAAIVQDARAIVDSAKALRARAQSIAEDVEPELTLAIDATFPMPLLMESLKALHGAFPKLPATVFTEALGGAEETLMSGAARMAIYPLRDVPPPDIAAEFLTNIALVPVVASGHPLARAAEPIAPRNAGAACPARADRPNRVRANVARRHRQPPSLALRRSDHAAGIPAGRVRLVQHALAHGRGPYRSGPPQAPRSADEATPIFRLYVASARGRELGRAGKWLVADLRERLKTCPGALQTGDARQGEPTAERLASETSGAGEIV